MLAPARSVGRILAAVALSVALSGNALACRGYRFWPTSEHDRRLAPNDIVIRASLLRAYESEGGQHAIMGSNHDFVYRIKVEAVLKQSNEGTITPGTMIYVENPGHICEFYRPWRSSKLKEIEAEPPKKIILRHHAGVWKVVGGE